MSAIGPGDLVECIHERTCRCGCAPGPLYFNRRIYVVAETCDHRGTCSGLLLREVAVPKPHHCFPVGDFRPIGRPAEGIIQSLLQPAPSTPEVEPA